MTASDELAGVDAEGIQRILPHRYPFLLVDRVIELDPPHRAVGIKQVTVNEPFFQGHFPERHRHGIWHGYGRRRARLPRRHHVRTRRQAGGAAAGLSDAPPPPGPDVDLPLLTAISWMEILSLCPRPDG